MILKKNVEYDIVIEKDYKNLSSVFSNNNMHYENICLVTDTNVENLYLEDVLVELKKVCNNISTFTFPAGEESKNLDTISHMYKHCINHDLDRKSLIVALGGGVVGDMAGFLASTYMRGIDFIQLPTTLLAQVDSSVGGKVGVDFLGNKNMVGAFYQPKFVYINIATLKTLNSLEFSSGLVEAMKHGFIADKEYLDYIYNNIEDILNVNLDVLEYLVSVSIEIKSYIVSVDEKENGIRALLNFGHTFGHAVESLEDFRIVHGRCVAIGMIGALYLSHLENSFPISEIEFTIGKFRELGLLSEQLDLNRNEIFDMMLHDKKSVNKNINFVLLEKCGKAYIKNNISEENILMSIDFLLETMNFNKIKN